MVVDCEGGTVGRELGGYVMGREVGNLDWSKDGCAVGFSIG